jgi:hypothetical protein
VDVPRQSFVPICPYLFCDLIIDVVLCFLDSQGRGK